MKWVIMREGEEDCARITHFSGVNHLPKISPVGEARWFDAKALQKTFPSVIGYGTEVVLLL